LYAELQARVLDWLHTIFTRFKYKSVYL